MAEHIGVTSYAQQLRRQLLKGLPLANLLDADRDLQQYLSSLGRRSVKTTQDVFAYKFLKDLRLTDSRFLTRKKKAAGKGASTSGIFPKFFRDVTDCFDDDQCKQKLCEKYRSMLGTIKLNNSLKGADKSELKKISQIKLMEYLFLPDNFALFFRNCRMLKSMERLNIFAEYTNKGFLWRRTVRGNNKFLEIDISFSTLPSELTDELIRKLILPKPGNLLQEKKHPAVKELTKFIFATGKDKSVNSGIFYDTGKHYSQIRDEYFPHWEDDPGCQWSSQYSCRRVGTYSFTTDRISLSLIFDIDAPIENIASFVLYHEMLHREVGLKEKNGRNFAHTAQFRRSEKLFPDAEKLEMELQKLVSYPAKYLNISLP